MWSSRHRRYSGTTHINMPVPPADLSHASAFTMTGRRYPRMSLPPTPTMSTPTQEWVPKKLGITMEGRVPQNSKVKRWDGAARSCSDWDNLRRDPELWFRGGNCFVHLYGKGQSRRGPAFKVPFGALLSAKCHPFVKRFMSRDTMPESPVSFDDQYDDLDRWNALNPNEKVELYIPAPPMADKEQSFAYHLATRNFFAWIFRRSVVGEHLGTALIGLLNSMAEFRGNDQDNIPDLMSYLDEEGYLDIKGQPHQALALLNLSEFFQMRDMYIDAFSHCVGMSEELPYSPEYQHIGSVTKTHIRRAVANMNARLSKAGGMLNLFLEEELSETHLGLPAGGRAHLDRFRAFTKSFYTTKLGAYPPLSFDAQKNPVFEPEVLAIMRKDFQAVYELLVDESFTSAESSPILAQGGICTYQSVNDFDRRCKFQSLRHPLPLLPEPAGDRSARRVSLQWLANTTRGDKLKPDQRLVAHSALIKAMNMRDQDLLENDFVRAYRKFEEDSVSPLSRVDKVEKISLVDARKVRWILIYATYQVLLSCTQAPPEVRDVEKVGYHLAVSTEKLPPWKEGRNLQSLLRKQTDLTTNVKRTQSVTDWASKCNAVPSLIVTPTIDIRPDIDYMARSRQEEERVSRRQSECVSSTGTGAARSRSRSLSRSNPFRRSLSIFRKLEEQCAPAPAPRKASYCEIVVHGYGNGTNAVKKSIIPPPEVSPRTVTAPRSFSTSSESSSVSEPQSLGAFSFATAESTAPPTSPEAVCKNWPNQGSPMLSPVPLRGRRRVKAVLAFAEPAEPPRASSPHFSSPELSDKRRHSVMSYAHDYEELIKQQESDFHRHELEPLPLQIRKTSMPLHTELHAESPVLGTIDVDIKPEWEQYKDLGGLTSLSPLKI
ncbi:Choriogenin Hminor [Colletotrichum higginsianum IMI 349063]|uniref:Choriogenin Hminor n=3 Tax=Colletotrichum higginsianum TaxID=80884 RepID=A0A1B7YQY1_COLHI|nr:Choriogenin Hminor [Colletotrichum higginsianum IMI 349063]OBR14445.1 Choriogenin Hminor [Colletotrichum higginsianum IMI 349063]